jgi:hypothetical protein
MPEENFDEEFDQLHQKVKALEDRIKTLEEPQSVFLCSRDGKFRVQLALEGLAVVATPMLLDPKTGEWRAEVAANSPLTRWQVHHDTSRNQSSLIRIS